MHLLKGFLACAALLAATVSVCIVLTWWAFKLNFTKNEARSELKQRMDDIIIWWTSANRLMIKFLGLTTANVQWHNRAEVSPNEWYLVICNHQSWADILILQTFLLDTIPPLKFFTKSQLIWIPFVGIAMYALGFPYVKRVSRDQIRANPALRHVDRDNVFKACEGFNNHPTCVLNFLEGTRFTAEKHRRQSSDYQHLLRPKAGGVDYVLQGMAGRLKTVVDVTIVYPGGAPTFWDFLQGKCKEVHIDIRQHSLPELTGLEDDAQRKAKLAQWTRQIWSAKDQLITELLDV
ncbi:MAG: acyltransferase [Gammaproteobacteria bacterium]|nr:acyltransferase [Gammaproteobacteria bacterium]|tara:strand:- start:2182 stop:3054 length:873 start_codon:yes stop_codon:yes gene_type:complete